MTTLNYLCRNDVSDDDCNKCIKHGIVFRCPAGCPDFDDVRKYMTKRTIEKREEIMKQYGLQDNNPAKGEEND